MDRPPTAPGTLLLGSFPEAERLRQALLARGREPLHETLDLLAAARRLRLEPLGLIVMPKDIGAAGAAPLVQALRFDAKSASRRAKVLVFGTHFAQGELGPLRDAGVTKVVHWPVPDTILERLLDTLDVDRRMWIESPGYCGPCRRLKRDGFVRFATAKRAKDFMRK